MCGIFGIYYHLSDFVPDVSLLKESAELLKHRGPDSTGIFTENGIGLVHTRLSLLDLSERGNQPFWDAKKRYAIIYNGEVYNFKELKDSLKKNGVEFKSNTDTEVILEYVKMFGAESTLKNLEGMFAFAIYDRLDKTILIARDRFGIKPLFYVDEENAFIFSSEIAAMRQWISLEPDPWSIASYMLGFGGPSKENTFYKKIKILNPGTFVHVVKGQKTRFANFFSIPKFFDDDYSRKIQEWKPNQIIDKVEEHLIKSIDMQLFADAPVGCLCSGGIDSALVTAIAAKSHKNLAVFHADVVGRCSEYDAAKRLCDYLKIDLKTIQVTDDDCLNLLPDVIRFFGHPFWIMPSSIPFYKVAKLVRENNVKAVLTGEGSDECFLGYPFLLPEKERNDNFCARLRRIAKHNLKFLKKFYDDNDIPPFYTYGFSPFSKQASMKLAEDTMHFFNRFEVINETEILNKETFSTKKERYEYISSLDLLNYNLRMLLFRNDSMGMAASIESRFPYLDTSLVKFAVNIPKRYKLHLTALGENKNWGTYTNKWVIRKVAERYLPKDITERPKQYFRYDVFRRIKIKPNFFKNSAVTSAIELTESQIENILDKYDVDFQVRLLQLELWWEKCIMNLPNDEILNKLKEYVTFLPPSKMDRWIDTG